MSKVLAPLAFATELLTTESTPAAGCTYYLLHELLSNDLAVTERPDDDDEDMATSEARPDEDEVPGAADGNDESDGEDDQDDDIYDSTLAAKLKRCISSKLMDRFAVNDEGQPDMALCRSCPLLVASFCDPR